MAFQIYNSAHPLNDADILDFEVKGNIRLPDAYRRFLIEHNGGKPSPKRFITLDKKVESMVTMFFPISSTADDSLVNEFKEFNILNKIPSNLISIAVDPVENRILLSIAGGDCGSVYYWSFDEEPENPTCSYEYLRLISTSFDDFVSSLT